MSTMGPEERVVPRFAAEPPQEELPYGRWAERLARELLAAADALDTEGEDLGEVRAVTWYPDRSWHGWTYVPATAATSNGYELFGYVRFQRGAEEEAAAFSAHVDFTQETAERNPDWQLDICEEVIGSWHGEGGAEAAVTLVWGRPLVPDGIVATAELADLTVDQCIVIEQRFTLIAPDDYRGDLLEIKLYDERGGELARESLYAGEDEEESPPA
ncbi:MAG TPA: hypothetical protein VFW29_10565 [Solirubrobacteraceae bacterium]|nr:hypothetical protein [Solirubrobacteraceae bacterium]